MAQPKVFVSHSHVDNDFAEWLVTDLRAAGVDAWLDKQQLRGGDFQEDINKALGECEWFVLVLTRDAVASKWVRQEVHAANVLKSLDKIRDLIFIQAGPLDLKEIPALWLAYQFIDCSNNRSRAREQLIRTIVWSQRAPDPELPLSTVMSLVLRVCERCGKIIDPMITETCSFHPGTLRRLRPLEVAGILGVSLDFSVYRWSCCGEFRYGTKRKWPGCQTATSHKWADEDERIYQANSERFHNRL